MNSNLRKKLVETYPELYHLIHTPGDSPHRPISLFMFEVGDGWYQIIDNLSYTLTMSHRGAKKDLEYWTKNLGKEVWPGRISTQEDIDREQKKLDETFCPVAIQVKEKFGNLRFYVDRATDAQYNYIGFAEIMSGRTCEVCGNPGQTYHMGWYRTLCDEHADENYGEEAIEYRNKTGHWTEEEE